MNSNDPNEASYYWHGNIPEVVILDGNGNVILDEEGQVPLEKINKASGLDEPSYKITIKSFNEYSSEPSKEGYTKPRSPNQK